MPSKRNLVFLISVIIHPYLVFITGGFQVNEESRKDELLHRRCGHAVTKPDDFISVPSVKALRQRNDTILLKEKTLIQLFENPQGNKFEVLTVKQASVTTLGEKFTEFSWFPGFSWSMILCPQCGFHLGWKFDPVDEDESKISFFGLIFANLVGSSYADSLLLTPKSYQS